MYLASPYHITLHFASVKGKYMGKSWRFYSKLRLAGKKLVAEVTMEYYCVEPEVIIGKILTCYCDFAVCGTVNV